MSELSVQRRLTTAFINTQPVVLTLIPRTRTKQPAGGFVWTEQPARAPQTMRLLEPTLAMGSTEPTVTLDGIVRRTNFILLGEWNAAIGTYDVFTHDGGEWEVVQLLHFNGWERRAAVSRRG